MHYCIVYRVDFLAVQRGNILAEKDIRHPFNIFNMWNINANSTIFALNNLNVKGNTITSTQISLYLYLNLYTLYHV